MTTHPHALTLTAFSAIPYLKPTLLSIFVDLISNSSLMSGFIGAVVGGLIAGFFSWTATNRAHKNAEVLTQKRRKQTIVSFLLAVKEEIKVLQVLHQKHIGVYLEAYRDGDDPSNYLWSVTEDYFSVYKTNCINLGLVNQHELRAMIVKTYLHAMSLVDSIKLYSELVREYSTAKSGLYGDATRISNLRNSLVDYIKTLKGSQNEFYGDVDILIQLLDKEVKVIQSAKEY